MDTDTITRIIATARPGSRVWYIEVPADDAPERAEAAGAEQTPDAAERRLPATDLGAASTIAPTAALKLADWSGILPGVSVRELERAIKAEALPAKAKGDGRDWAALAITGQAMVDYLATCDAVQYGKRLAPDWWASVRKGGNATISRAG